MTKEKININNSLVLCQTKYTFILYIIKIHCMIIHAPAASSALKQQKNNKTVIIIALLYNTIHTYNEENETYVILYLLHAEISQLACLRVQ